MSPLSTRMGVINTHYNQLRTTHVFEPWYLPSIIYDESCLLKKLGLKRETELVMNMLITTDPLRVSHFDKSCLSTPANSSRVF